MKSSRLDLSTDYRLALLWFMDRLELARVSEVTTAFERELGDLIPTEHRETSEGGWIKWERCVAWARFVLVQAGLMGSSGRGVWTITPAGKAWLRENPNRLSPAVPYPKLASKPNKSARPESWLRRRCGV